MIRKWWLVLALWVCLVGGVVAQSDDPTGTITVIPPAGPIGTSHDVSAQGLTPNVSYSLVVTLRETGEIVYTTTLVADNDGVLSISLYTEPSDALGVYDVEVYDGDALVRQGTITITDGERQRTTITGVLVSGQPVRTSLSSTILADLYSFNASVGDRVTISLESDDFDAYLEVFNLEGITLTFDNDGGRGSNALIRTLELPVASTYFVVATSADGTQTGEYTLTLTTARRADEGEIAPGEIVIGTLTTARQRAEYTFFAQVGDRVTLDLASDDFDPLVRLLDPNGVELMLNDDGGPGLYALINNFALNQTGEYTVVADANRGAVGRRVVSGDYALGLTLVRDGVALTPDRPPVTEDIITPQPTTSPPVTGVDNRISYGETVLGVLTEDVQRIEFIFNGEQGETVVISAESDDFDSLLILLDPQGNQVAFDDDTGGQLNPLIAGYTLETSGTFTIVVDGYRGVNTDRVLLGSFTLTLERVENRFMPELTPTPMVTPLEDTPVIRYGEPVRGTLISGMTARYQFRGSAGDAVTILLESDEFDPLVRLFMQPDDVQIAYDDDSAGDLNALLEGFVLPQTGVYVIVVDYWGTVRDTGSYTLTLTSAGGTAQPAEPTPLPQIPATPEPPRATTSSGALAYGEPTLITFSGAQDEAYLYTFTAQDGDIITVRVDSSASIDTRLILTSQDGAVQVIDDDSGAGFDPELYRLPVPAGEHRLEIVPYIAGASGDVSLVVIRESPLALDGVPRVVQISDKHPVQALTFNGAGGTNARVTVVSRSQVEGNPLVQVTQDGVLIAQNSVGIMARVIFEFPVPQDGLLTLTISLPDADAGYGVLEIIAETVE